MLKNCNSDTKLNYNNLSCDDYIFHPLIQLLDKLSQMVRLFNESTLEEAEISFKSHIKDTAIINLYFKKFYRQGTFISFNNKTTYAHIDDISGYICNCVGWGKQINSASELKEFLENIPGIEDEDQRILNEIISKTKEIMSKTKIDFN